MTMVETVADQYSGLRAQRAVWAIAPAAARLRFQAMMRAETRHRDCPTCLWPDGLQMTPGVFPPECRDRWHWVAEGVLAGLRGPALGGSAMVSQDGRYRYELRRRWRHDGLTACWLMLNPSTADADTDDATIRRIIGFSQSWGFAGLVVRNLYAFRATDPAEMLRAEDPFGPGNDRVLGHCTREAVTVLAWGDNADPVHAAAVVADLQQAGAVLRHLGRTKRGNPRHPVRLAGNTPLQTWGL